MLEKTRDATSDQNNKNTCMLHAINRYFASARTEQGLEIHVVEVDDPGIARDDNNYSIMHFLSR